MNETVLVSRDDGVLTIRMNRADKKNALDRAMYRAMGDALREASGDASVGAVLLAGVPGAFCAGNDITDLVAFSHGGTRPDEIEAFLFALVRCDKPLVAAVDGLAIGIGTTMLLHCDVVHATERSVFRTPFVDLALLPEAGSSLLAPRLMGHQRAFALLAAGETFSAEDARAANVVTRIGDAEADALAAAKTLAKKPRESMRLTRELLRGALREEIEARISHEIDQFSERLRSDEAKAAFAAFMSRPRS